jgi:acyl carrier protein
MTNREKLSCDAFTELVAVTLNVSSAGLRPETRLIEDLGLDSLALAELLVVMITELRMERLAEDLGDREWTNVTLGELYEEYERGEPVAREEYVIRAKPRA